VDVKVHVGTSGTVTQVQVGSRFASTDLGTCIVQTIKRWHFPSLDSEYDTEIPLILTAN
jgi:hypothetical protein